MNDFEPLTTWIQPQHLAASGVDAQRAEFENHPMRVLHIRDFLQEEMVARLGRFLTQEACYEQVYCLYAGDGKTAGNQVSAEVWQAADEGSRWYTHGMLTGPDPRFRLSPNLFTYLDFRKVLATSAFRTYVSAITGLPLGDVINRVVHRIGQGDRLGPHHDRAGGRRVTFVFYLSPGWKAEYGGALHIIGKHDERSTIEPTFNSLMVFDVMTQEVHYVTDVRDTAGDQARLTIGGWFSESE